MTQHARTPVPNSQVEISNLKAWRNSLLERKQPVKRLLHSDRGIHNVLVIGSGHRIRTNYVSALQSLSSAFHVTGIWSRNTNNAGKIANMTNWPVVETLDKKTVAASHVIVISITTSAVPGMVKNLLELADCSEKHLVLDTPVFAGLRQSFFTHYLRHFASVSTTEDYMNFPQFAHLRSLAQSGMAGKIKKVTLNNTGYLYHGLALGRSFFNFELVEKCSRRQNQLLYTLANGAVIEINLPYQRLAGSVTAEGDKDTLHYVNATNKTACQEALSSFDNVITERWDNGEFSGFTIKAQGRYDHVSPEFLSHPDKPDCHQDHIFQSCKTLGLVEVFKSLYQHNINSQYHFLQALYDNYVSHLSLKPSGKVVSDYRLPMRWLELMAMR